MIAEETICNTLCDLILFIDNKDPENIVFGGKIS